MHSHYLLRRLLCGSIGYTECYITGSNKEIVFSSVFLLFLTFRVSKHFFSITFDVDCDRGNGLVMVSSGRLRMKERWLKILELSKRVQMGILVKNWFAGNVYGNLLEERKQKKEADAREP